MFHTALYIEIENMFRILVTFTEAAEAVEAIRVIRSAKQKCPPVKVNKGFSPFAFLAFILISVNTIMNISNNISNNNRTIRRKGGVHPIGKDRHDYLEERGDNVAFTP